MSSERNIDIIENKIIDNLFIFNLNYVNDYSEFLYDSLSLNWNNIISVSNNARHLDKIKKNLDKLYKIENKKSSLKSVQSLIVENKNKIEGLSDSISDKMIKKILLQLGDCSSLRDILQLYLNLYIDFNKVKAKKNENLEDVVKKIKLKDNNATCNNNLVKSLVFSEGKDGKYYSNILITDNKMLLDKESFECEVALYNEMLYKHKSLKFLEDKKDYSSFEKKRRIYIKSMFEIDRNMVLLSQKNVDITFPVEKIFKIAKDLLDYIYIEIIEYEDATSVLKTLANLTIEAYGTKRKVKMYEDLINNTFEKLNNVDDLVYQEVVNTAKTVILKNGYRDFKNISTIFPTINDVYKAVNEKVVSYLRRNINVVLSNKKDLSLFVSYMSLEEIVNLYAIIKDEIYYNKFETKYFIIIQENIVGILRDKFDLTENEILNTILKESKLY